jgi:hypothetical protein
MLRRNEMIYLIKKNGMVIAHTDLAAMEALDGISTPDMAMTEAAWGAAGGLARIIGGEIVLGKTAEEQRAEKEEEIRAQRERILRETVDRVNGPWWEAMAEGEKAAWRAYRQALLDLPEQEGYPFNLSWPARPD